MKTRKCQHCQREITGKREDAKFCSNTCKAKHWEMNRASTKEAEKKEVTSQLRGLLNQSKPVEPASKISDVSFKEAMAKLAIVSAASEIRRLTDVRNQLEKEILSLQRESKEIQEDNGNSWVIGCGGAGAILGNHAGGNKTENTFLGSIAGIITGIAIRNVTEDNREENKKKLIAEKQKEIRVRLTRIQEIDKDIKISEDKVKALKADSDAKASKTLPVGDKDVCDSSSAHIKSDKVISSGSLNKMEFDALNFQGKWNEFFGYPSINFHLVIHGLAGEGKSTLAIQLAKYLADNFGRVIYISGEEGFSKTFKDKMAGNNAESKFLDVADLRTFDDVLKDIPIETYNFIFFDSLDNMRIDADRMKKLRTYYKNSALITISQSTKDGKMRGSYEIVHDSDIAVIVEKGIATTTKNRFKEKSMTLEVF